MEAILVVVDSDDSMPHGAHDNDAPDNCRFCLIRSVLEAEISKLTAVPNRPSLMIAVGLCVPAIEAWYLCGIDATVTEAAWINGRESGQRPYTRQELKRRAYGSTTPDVDTQTREALKHAGRLSADLNALGTWFPHGCGTMLTAVAEWKQAG